MTVLPAPAVDIGKFARHVHDMCMSAAEVPIARRKKRRRKKRQRLEKMCDGCLDSRFSTATTMVASILRPDRGS